ncbi:hypothetical protein KBY67_14305 [Synechococcus sp. RedBA-s]|nr:hypothetical protein [Synechococcus sp. RedBA-s]
MKRGIFVQWSTSYYSSSILFDTDSTRIHSYYTIPHALLRQALIRYGILLCPIEEFGEDKRADFLISVDLPISRIEIERACDKLLNPGGPRILIVMESAHSMPELLCKSEFSNWSHVIHYTSLLPSSVKRYYYTLPSNLSYLSAQGQDYTHDRHRLVGMMSTNKPSRLTATISRRVRSHWSAYRYDSAGVFRWLRQEDGLRLRRHFSKRLAKLIPDDFRVFGGQWDGSSFAPHHRVLKPKANPCSKGPTSCNSISIIRGFKYFFATENLIGDDGYLTEKLFNVIRAGSVPIYKPATDSRVFPFTGAHANLPFIDLRMVKNNSVSQLVSLLRNIKPDTYQKYLQAGKEFLSSQLAVSHTPCAYAKSMSKLLSDLIVSSGQ